MTRPNAVDKLARGYEAQWAHAANRIASANISGLRTQCPVCARRGSVLSKWIPKASTKPLFVAHAAKDGDPSVCPVPADETDILRSALRFSKADLKKALRLGRPFVMFSGGSDSVCLLHYMVTVADEIGVPITALHADTTAGLPEVEEYVVEVCRLLGVPLVTVKPEHDYFEIAKKWGIPGVRARWCCETLKIAPMRRYLSTVEGPKVVFDGIRAEESPVRANYVPMWFHPAFRSLSVSPIIYWSNRKVSRYNASNGLPANPTADLGTSAECWCGAYKCRADFEALLDVNPGIFDKLVEVEEAQEGRFTFIYEQGQQVPLSSLRDG